MEREGQIGLKEWFASEGVKQVLFDMDSTLVETVDHYRVRMHKYCEFLSGECGREEAELFDTLMGGIDALRGEFSVEPPVLGVPARVLAKMCGVEGLELEKQVDELMKIYELSPEVSLGAVGQVRLVRDAGVETFVVTHADKEWTREKMRPFWGLFKDYVCTPTNRPKNLQAWEDALEKLGVEPEEVMVVGDSWVSDVEPALELGVKKVVWIRNGALAKNDTRVIEIESIADLVGGLLVR